MRVGQDACAAHRAIVDEGLDGVHEALLQRREPRNVRRHALP